MRAIRLLEPQELAFAALYVSLLGRFIVAGAVFTAGFAILLGISLCHLLAVWWFARRSTPQSLLWRCWMVVPAMLGNYLMLGHWMQVLGGSRSSWLEAADRFCFGPLANGWPAAWEYPWLTEILSFAYLIFHPLIAYSLWQHARKPDERATAVLRTFGTLWGFGFLGYTLIPAAGPYLEIPERYAAPFSGGWITTLNAWLILQGSNRVDCFPSLHCAVSGAILLFEWRRSRWAGCLLTPLVAALWLSTIYLRQHYLVDVVAGAVLLAVVYGRCGLEASSGKDGRSK